MGPSYAFFFEGDDGIAQYAAAADVHADVGGPGRGSETEVPLKPQEVACDDTSTYVAQWLSTNYASASTHPATKR